MTTMMAPFMSCGARLTVYALFAAAFFPDNGQNIVFALYLIGIAVAVFTAFLLRRFMLPAQDSAFTMELPPYLLPTSRNLFMHTWHRLKGFFMRAGKAIVAVVIVLNVLNSVGTDGSFGNENQTNSVLSEVGRSITPIFTPMGIEENNWPATVGIFTGLFAKEVVVGTLDALYSTTDSTDEDFHLIDSVAAALATIPTNVMEVLGNLADPLGLDLGDLNDAHTIAASQEIQLTTLDALQTFFVNPWAAFCYLLFILLYMPCVATVGAIVKEHGHFWAGFSMLWSFSVGYVLSVGVYQLAMWFMHPVSSTIWITVLLVWQLIFTTWLLRTGKRQATRENLIPMVQVK